MQAYYYITLQGHYLLGQLINYF